MSLQIPPLRGLVLGGDTFYTDAVPTGLKRALKYPKFVAKVWHSFKQHLPFLGVETVIFSKIDTYGWGIRYTYRSFNFYFQTHVKEVFEVFKVSA